jgi:RecB family exonuclease
MKWSFSSLKQFKTCPKQYYEIRVAKNYRSRDSADSLYGKAVHKALEDYVRDSTPLPANYARFAKLVDPLLEIPGTRYCEYEMALRRDKTPCEFTAPDYWVRGITDLLIVDDDTAYNIDYKTGKTGYADTTQLMLMALMTFHHFPKVQRVKAGLMFLVYDQFFPEEYVREKEDQYWKQFYETLDRLELSFQNSLWPANPTGLCRRHCPVETCKFYGGY